MESFENHRCSTPIPINLLQDFSFSLDLSIVHLPPPELIRSVLPDLPPVRSGSHNSCDIVGVDEDLFKEDIANDSAINYPWHYDSNFNHEVIEAPPAHLLPHPTQFFS